MSHWPFLGNGPALALARASCSRAGWPQRKPECGAWTCQQKRERLSTSLGSRSPGVKEQGGRNAGPGSFPAKTPKRALSELTKLKLEFSGKLSAVPSLSSTDGPPRAHQPSLSGPLLKASCGLTPHRNPARGCAGLGGEGAPSGTVGPKLPLTSVNNKPSWNLARPHRRPA